MRRTPVCLISSFAIVVGLLGCSDSDAGSAPNAATNSDDIAMSEAWPDPIRFGLVPAEGGADTVARFEPLAEHLRTELGCKVDVFSASEYVGVITAMQNDQVDVAYFGPKSYVEANRIAGAEALVREITEDGSEGYFSVLVSREGSGIQTMDDAKGRSFAFVTPNSTSGYLVPFLGIREATGMVADEYFGEVRYTGSHGTSIRAVLAGDVEVAATNTLDLKAMQQSGLDISPLVELWRSELIPGSVIAVRRELPQSLKDAVQKAVVGFSENAAALEEMGRSGFVPTNDGAYEIIRLLEQQEHELSEESGG